MLASSSVPRAVTELSSSSDSEPLRGNRGVKRKRCKGNRESGGKRARARLSLDDEIGIQLFLSRKCGAKCTRRCKEAFLKKQSLPKFRAFRKEWCQYHKTDQDTVET